MLAQLVTFELLVPIDHKVLEVKHMNEQQALYLQELIFRAQQYFQHLRQSVHNKSHILYSELGNHTLAVFFFFISKARRSEAQSKQRSWLQASIRISSGNFLHFVQGWGWSMIINITKLQILNMAYIYEIRKYSNSSFTSFLSINSVIISSINCNNAYILQIIIFASHAKISILRTILFCWNGR